MPSSQGHAQPAPPPSHPQTTIPRPTRVPRRATLHVQIDPARPHAMPRHTSPTKVGPTHPRKCGLLGYVSSRHSKRMCYGKKKTNSRMSRLFGPVPLTASRIRQAATGRGSACLTAVLVLSGLVRHARLHRAPPIRLAPTHQIERCVATVQPCSRGCCRCASAPTAGSHGLQLTTRVGCIAGESRSKLASTLPT